MDNLICKKELCINPFNTSDCIWWFSNDIENVRFPYVPISHILKLINEGIATPTQYFTAVA